MYVIFFSVLTRKGNANGYFSRKRGHKAKAKSYLLLAILIPFFLSSVYWALRLADLVISLSSLASSNKSSLKVDDYKLLFGSIILLNVSCSYWNAYCVQYYA